ncbi:hypothetical protein ACFL6X_07680 [Candidatus Latescibacterota bacterium]
MAEEKSRVLGLVGSPRRGLNTAHLVEAVLSGAWGEDNDHTYDGVMDWLKERLSFYFDIETVAILTAADTANRPVWDRQDLLEQARSAGRELAEAMG